MKLSAQERAEHRSAFRQMNLAGKLEYVAAYYKLPIILGLIAVILLGSAIGHALARKEVLLYVGYVNVSVGDDLQNLLSEGFVTATGASTKKYKVSAYTGLYLSDSPAAENHQYSYASRLKVLAAVNAKQLDIVWMNREAYDIFSQSGYLLDLSEFLSQSSPELYPDLAPYLIENDVILEDNAIAYTLNEADSYTSVTEKAVNAMEITDFRMVSDAGFPDSVYLGVIANSQRRSADLDYIKYLFSSDR